MGKAQSKRSVDITTEAKKDDVIEEGTGKMGKIEDVDQLKPQVNGDTNHTDVEVAEKEKAAADTDGTENEKDLSTEKEQQQIQPKPNLESGDNTTPAATSQDNKSVDNCSSDDTLNESKITENASTTTIETDDSSKKVKKEKVKKKWSFRSISFGKKDKQKPAKKDEAAVNGECEKVPEEVTEEQSSPVKPVDGATEEVSPAVEEKSASSPETEKLEQNKEPVLNGGTTEPVTEDKQQPATESASEVSLPPVVEAKKPEETINEETQKVETVAEQPPPQPVAEISKSNDTEQPAKIEVKAEDIQENNANIPNENDAHIQQDNKNADLDKVNNDGDSESAQNLPPPPLPITPPPSQVMVFALSDIKDQNEDEQLPIPASIANISDDIQANSDMPVKSVGSTTEDVTNKQESENLLVSNTKDDQDIKIETDVAAPAIDNDNLKTDVTCNTETTSNTNIVEPSSKEAEIPNESADNKEQIEQNLLKDPVILETLTKHEGEINPEQIAETIALIDEVTQEAVAITLQKLQDSTSTDVPVDNPETTSPILPPTEHKEQHITTEAENICTSILTELSSSTPDQISPSSMDPEKQSNTETNIPSGPLETETENENKVSNEILQENAINIMDEHQQEQHKSEQNPSDLINITEAALTAALNENIINPSIEEPSDNKAVDAVAAVMMPTNELDSQQEETSKLKENGVGENHEQPAETSATESLNGHEHKTIEEIKSEQQTDKLNNDVMEIAAGTVTVNE